MVTYLVLRWWCNKNSLGSKLAHDLQGPWQLDVIVSLCLKNLLASLGCRHEQPLRAKESIVSDQPIIGYLIDPFDEFIIIWLGQQTLQERSLFWTGQVSKRTEISWIQNNMIDCQAYQVNKGKGQHRQQVTQGTVTSVSTGLGP
jgi:hypothetical protein